MAVDRDTRKRREDAECENAFLTFGGDLNAKLTPREFAHALHLAGRSPTREYVKKCKLASKDASGKLSYRDFQNSMAELVPMSMDSLIEAFQKLDRNGDGYLTHSELTEALTTGGEPMTGDEVDMMIEEADQDGNGKINYKEFCEMISKTASTLRSKCVKGSISRPGSSSTGGGGVSRKPSSSKLSSIPSSSLSSSRPSSSTARDKSPRASSRSRSSRPSSSESMKKTEELEIDRSFTKWDNVHAKGTFYAMDDVNGRYCCSHHFALTLSENALVTITLDKDEDDRFKGELDYTILVLRVGPHGGYKLVGTSITKIGGKVEFQLKLKKGEYMVVPFTTGSRLYKRTSSSQDAKVTEGKKLSADAKRAIKEIFSRADLDENGLVSRPEFDLLQIQTTGEPTNDEAWEYFVSEVDSKKNELTESGFLDLYQQMLNEEGAEAVLDDLSKLGYSRSSLRLTEASTFKIYAYSKHCDPELEVTLFDYDVFLQAIQQNITEKGSSKLIKNDIILYSLETPERCSYAIENGRGKDQNIVADCSGSKNCVTNLQGLKQSVKIKGGEFRLLHQLTPESERKQMVPRISCEVK